MIESRAAMGAGIGADNLMGCATRLVMAASACCASYCASGAACNAPWVDDPAADSGLDDTPQPATASNRPAAKPWATGRRKCTGRDMGADLGKK
ncbi:hypothetical protein PproGo58_01600 [Pseudomonas protegens]|nr:hypothetical protein PproGo58_01600 [Pseudomonas protegens]